MGPVLPNLGRAWGRSGSSHGHGTEDDEAAGWATAKLPAAAPWPPPPLAALLLLLAALPLSRAPAPDGAASGVAALQLLLLEAGVAPPSRLPLAVGSVCVL